jgi:hypothetical protein
MLSKDISSKKAYSPKILDLTSKFWFAATTIGQWIFGLYIIAVYYVPTLSLEFEKWNKVLPKGYVTGDFKGNLVVGIHVILAAIVVIGGPLQFMPFIRDRFKKFHRALGKTYVLTTMLISIGGLIMVWTRGTVGDMIQYVNISIQAIYIILFGALTIKFARERKIINHRIWALRLFMVSSGVWFFRVFLMAWLVIHKAPVGFDPETFSGPFLSVLSTLVYSIPLSLIVLELYLLAQKRQNQTLSNVTSFIILIFTLCMVVGITGATMGMWLPRM